MFDCGNADSDTNYTALKKHGRDITLLSSLPARQINYKTKEPLHPYLQPLD